MDKKINYFTIGNALTISRLVLLPVIIAGIALKIGYLAVIGMALALVTDLLDGRVSRYLKQASEFGGALDSTTDFIFLHLLFVSFYATHIIHTWQFIVIYLAMLMTLATELSANIIASKGKVIKTVFSKPVGALEYLYLLFLVTRLVLPESLADIVRIVDLSIFVPLTAVVLLHLGESVSCIKILNTPE